MKEECIFCKILEGDIPAYTIYENDHFKVILDRFPASEGHCLIIPKQHFEDIFDMSDLIASKIYPIAKKVAKVLKVVVEADGVNIVQNNGLVAGQTVKHFHLHLIPRKEGDDIVLNKTSNQEVTIEELAIIADKMRAAFE